MIQLLPHWRITETRSKIYDLESATSIEQTAKLYGKVQELITEYNKFVDLINEHLAEQDNDILEKFTEQDKRLDNQEQVQIPSTVKAEVEHYINEGEFDSAINIYLNHLNERLDNLLGSVTEGSTTLDAEVIDMRIGADGVTYETAGVGLRTQLDKIFKNVVPPIVNGLTSIFATGQTELSVSEENGVVTLGGNIIAGGGYAGCSLSLNKTYPEIIGKTIAIMVHEKTTLKDISVKLSNSNVSWGNAVNLGYINNFEQIYLFTVPESDKFTSKAFLCLELGIVGGEQNVKFSAYLMDVNEGSTLVGKSLFAYSHPVIKYVENAGFMDTSKLPFNSVYYNNEGGATITENTITITVAGEITSGSYSLGCLNLYSIKDKIKGIYIDADDVIKGDLYLTRVNYNWSDKITVLKRGYNDVTGLNLSNESLCYFMAGIYGSYVECTGTVRAYFIGDSTVIASSFIGQENYPTFNDVLAFQDNVVCWGDSLTAGGGWTTTLAELSGRTVYNGGTGGENSKCIMARQGGDVMVVNNITIPATTDPVLISSYNEGIATALGNSVKPLLQGGAHVNPVKIGDIEGTLKWTGSAYNDTTGTWTFTRSKEGEEVVINRPTAMTTSFDRDRNAPHLMIIFMGQNGGWNDVDDLVRQHKLMIEHTKANNIVILGLSSGTKESRAEYENAMQKEFGRYFISLRDYLSKYGLEDAGLTPTETDTTAMSVGQVPPQLLSDGVHYTDACKTVIGNMLYKKCVELNIF